MRIVKRIGQFCLRPVVWGSMLLLGVAICGGLILGRMITSPILQASNSTAGQIQATAGAQEPIKAVSARQNPSVIMAPQEPVVSIDLIKVNRPHRKLPPQQPQGLAVAKDVQKPTDKGDKVEIPKEPDTNSEAPPPPVETDKGDTGKKGEGDNLK